MGLKYRRFRAVAMTAGLILSMAGAGAALAADLADGVVTVHVVDPDGAAASGATIRIFFYRAGDEIPGIMPLGDPTDAAGAAVVTGVPYSSDPSDPILLDIHARLSTATVDSEGCTVHANWLAQATAVPSGPLVDVPLVLVLNGTPFVNCPDPTSTPPPNIEPTPTPVVDPTPSPTPSPAVEPTPAPSATPAGAALGATGQPQVTPPATDAVGDRGGLAGSSFSLVLLAILALATVIVPAGSLAAARAGARSRAKRY